ncbi:MAG: phosphatidylserine/phosphatidylglycerophosphate/cardiolipin synthase family protein [Deltaproteobacteria bacterium]|nr:phosphatidylserine/phosphatidylglycerophosphate/cardiolipin synthase family protein [Deltaproteobacteria bacterium]
MKISEANRTYLACDAYSKWKRLVSKAQECITVFSPYLDKLLLSLLNNSKIDNKAVALITDFNPSSLLDHPNQLKTIKKAFSKGISVLSLHGLHAKVLLVDDQFVTIGSQNFTSAGRRNKECTVVPSDSFTGTKLIDILLHWKEKAEPIDEEFVDLLISKLVRRIRQHKKLVKETRTEFEDIFERHLKEKQKSLIHRYEELERLSRIRMSNDVIYAAIEHIYNGGYDSLMADHGYDLTEWTIRKARGKTSPYNLDRLSIYPMILADNNRMGFVRIGMTRITYIRKSLEWTDNKLKIGDMSLNVNITFPETDTMKRNIVVRLSHSYLGYCEVAFLFTGDALRVVKKRYFKGSPHWKDEHGLFVTTLEDDFFASGEHLNSFFGQFFTSFKYNVLDRDNKNVRDYLKGDRFKLSVIQYQENPFLVIKKML